MEAKDKQTLELLGTACTDLLSAIANSAVYH